MLLRVLFLTLMQMLASFQCFFPIYHRTRPLASKKKLDDKGKPLIAAPFESQQGQAKSSTDASIVHESISLDYMTNTLKVF